MKFGAKVKSDNGEWIEFNDIRWIGLNDNGEPERICGPTGLQYSEFELVVND